MEYKSKLNQKISDLEVMSHVLSSIEEGRSHKRDHVDCKISEYIKWYDKTAYGNEVKGRSKFIDSTVSNYCNNVETSLIEPLVNTNDIVRLVSNVADTSVVTQAKLEEDLLNYQLTKKISSYRLLSETIKLITRQGIVATKLYWDYKSKEIIADSLFEEGELAEYKSLTQEEFTQALLHHKGNGDVPKDVKHNEDGTLTDVTFVYTNIISENPNYVNVPIANMYWSPSAQRISYVDYECDYVGEVKVMSNSDIRYKLLNDKSYRKFSKEEIDKLLKTKGINDIGEYTDPDEVAMVGKIKKAYEEIQSTYSKHAIGKQIVLEFHGLIDIDQDGINELVHIEIVNDKIIKLQLNNMYDNMIPYNVASFDEDPFAIDGNTIPSLLKDIQYIRTAIMRNMQDTLAFGTNQNYIVEDGMFDKNNMRRFINRAPGDIVKARTNIRGGGRLEDRIANIQSDPIKGEYFQVYNIMEQQAQENSGIPATTQGLTSESLNQTATGMSINDANGQKRLWKHTRTIIETFLKPSIEGFRIMNKTFLSETSFKSKDVDITISKDDIDLENDITINVAIKGFDAQKITQIIQWLNMAPAQMQMGAVTPDMVSAVNKDLLELWDMQDIASMVNPATAEVPQVDNAGQGNPGSPENNVNVGQLESPGLTTANNI
jgi:hypothetical protein